MERDFEHALQYSCAWVALAGALDNVPWLLFDTEWWRVRWLRAGSELYPLRIREQGEGQDMPRI